VPTPDMSLFLLLFSALFGMQCISTTRRYLNDETLRLDLTTKAYPYRTQSKSRNWYSHLNIDTRGNIL